MLKDTSDRRTGWTWDLLHYSWPQSAMTTLALGVPLRAPFFSISLTTSLPSTTLPNTTCFPFSLERRDEHLKQTGTSWLNLNAAVHASKWSSPVCFIRADEELGSVCVGPSISHGQCAHAQVLQIKVLITKLLPIDGFASSSIVSGKVPTLKKKKKKVDSAYVATAIGNLLAQVKSELVQKTGQIPCLHCTWHMKPGMIRWNVEPL